METGASVERIGTQESLAIEKNYFSHVHILDTNTSDRLKSSRVNITAE